MTEHEYCFHCGLKKHRPGGCGECGADAPGIEVERHPHYLPPGTLLNYGQYLVGRTLGAGGFGVTYLGVDVQLGRRLAIKELLPVSVAGRSPDGVNVASLTQGQETLKAGLDDFLREAKALVPFNDHPNIVSILDFFEENNTAYLVMPYLEGKTLAQLLEERGGRLEEEAAVIIAVAVLDALRATHRENLLHRDVKPGNVFLTEDGAIKLLDFGSARFVVGERTKTMTAVVTDGYAPYEQYQTKTKQGPATDIYAVGAMLYRMLTGKLPRAALMRLAEDGLVPPDQVLGGISGRVSDAIMIAMAMKPEDRFQSALAFINALTAMSLPPTSPAEPTRKPAPAPAMAVDPEPTRVKPESAKIKPATEKSRKGMWIGVGAVGAAGLIVLLAVLLTGGEKGAGQGTSPTLEVAATGGAVSPQTSGEPGPVSPSALLGMAGKLPTIGIMSSERPFVYDVNGDGVEDFVGRYRELDYGIQGYRAYIAALSGVDLKQLWRSDPIGKWPDETGMLSLRRVRDTLILAQAETLIAYGIADGKRLWAARLPDKLSQLGESNGAIRAESIDGKHSLINLQTGAGTVDASTTPLASMVESDEGLYQRPCRLIDLEKTVWKDLTVQGAYCPVPLRKWNPATPVTQRNVFAPEGCGNDFGVAYATRSVGSRIPYLVGYDRASKTVKWQVQLTPPGSVLELDSDPLLHMVDNRILAMYSVGRVPSVHLIDKSTGNEIWKKTLDGGNQHTSLGGLLTSARVFFHSGRALYLFDAKDGNRLAFVKDTN